MTIIRKDDNFFYGNFRIRVEDGEKVERDIIYDALLFWYIIEYYNPLFD